MEHIKTALVTGGASGLGYELSLLLAKDGYHLILIDINSEQLEEVKKELELGFKIKTRIITKDLSLQNCAFELFEEVKETSIDILINNAGFGLFGPFYSTDWNRELSMLNLHVITTTQLTKLLLDDMIKRGRGRILNVSSLAAFQPGPLMSIYYATKAFILSFSEAIANELKGTGVTVTVLCPGQTKTSFQEVVSEGNTTNKISFNIATADKVALYGYKAMMSGKTLAIPGTINKFLSFLPRILPRTIATAIVRKIQQKNRE